MADTQMQENDKVSWQWGGGRPGGEVAEVKEQGEMAVESKRGNTIKKSAEPDNPVVHIARPGNHVVKHASELAVEEKASATTGAHVHGDSANDEEKKSEPEQKDSEMKSTPHAQQGGEAENPTAEEKLDAAKQNGVAEPAQESQAEQGSKETNGDDKKPDTAQADDKATARKTGTKRKAEHSAAEEDTPGTARKPGRPKATEKRQKKAPARKRQSKMAATADGQPRRSGRNKA